MRAGDRLLKVNGHPVKSSADVRRLLNPAEPNTVLVERLDRAETSGPVEAAAAAAMATAAATAAAAADRGAAAAGALGSFAPALEHPAVS